MNIWLSLIIYFVCVGYSIFTTYKLGFRNGEDKGRRDMQKFMCENNKILERTEK